MSFNTADNAIYLPAVNVIFANYVAKTLSPSSRQLPHGLDVNDLAFWERGNKLFHYPYVLHSIGQFGVGSTINNALTQAGRTDRFLVGDSGGYQIGSGTLTGFKALHEGMSAQDAQDAWDSAYELKTWIIGWLDTYTHYAMTLDMPLWAVNNPKSPFHQCSIKQLTDMTVDNLEFIELHMTGGAKWLNVVQGLDEATTRDWWNAIKWFKHGGWALGGNAGNDGGLAQVIRTVLLMHHDDGDAFTAGQDWLHILGVSEVKWAIASTALQQCLRKINPKITVSYDSASPFQEAGVYEVAAIPPQFTNDPDTWRIRKTLSTDIQGPQFVSSTAPFPISSPIGKRMTMGDLNANDYKFAMKQFDTTSNMLLVNHNVWVYLDAFERANNAAFGADAKKLVPAAYLDGIEIMREAFDRPDWHKFIAKNQSRLDEFDKT